MGQGAFEGEECYRKHERNLLNHVFSAEQFCRYYQFL